MNPSKRLLALTLVATLGTLLWPASGSAEPFDEVLARYLDRLESDGWTVVESDPLGGDARQRHLRALLQQARTHRASPELVKRIEALQGIRRTSDPARSTEGLDKAGGVTGRVTRASDGQPLRDIQVLAHTTDGSFTNFAFTDTNGEYRIDLFVPGQYLVEARSYAEYVTELHDGVHCTGGVSVGCHPSDGTPVAVGENGDVTVDFSLELGGSVSGRLTETATGLPIPFFSVRLSNADGNIVAEATTFDPGTFDLVGLETGTYFAFTESFGSYRDEVYDSIPCTPHRTPCDPLAGTPIEVVRGSATTGIDFSLEQYGRISGRMTDGRFGDPIPFQSAAVWDSDGQFVSSTNTDHQGLFLLENLEAGSYFVTTSNILGYLDELYDDIPCPDENCDVTTGTPIEVKLDEEATGIDFELLGGCTETETAMCLNNSRFRVEADWRTNAGNTGKGRTVVLTSDSGYFWFFGPDNIEMVVKVLDACSLPGANKFWVFAGGLTDVEVTLTVTDTQTGQVRTYANPIGTPFQPIQDTAAFDTCP